MITNKISLEPNGATLTCYINEENISLPAMLVFPGGAYRYCSPGEGEPVALAYMKNGYNAFVLEYSCLEGLYGSPKKELDEVFDSAIEDAINAYYYLVDHKDELKIDDTHISIIGFSAGANLALSSVLVGEINPFSLLLGYGAFSKKMNEELNINDIDLLKKINKDTPPTFMFLCQADSVVPARESFDLANLLFENNVPVELHCYLTGDHGLSLGTKESGVINNDYATWFNHSLSFNNNLKSGVPLIMGNISEDLVNISTESRIGALMYNKEAWELIKQYFPDVAFKAQTDVSLRSKPFSRLYRWGMIETPSEDEFNKLLSNLSNN